MIQKSKYIYYLILIFLSFQLSAQNSTWQPASFEVVKIQLQNIQNSTIRPRIFGKQTQYRRIGNRIARFDRSRTALWMHTKMGRMLCCN